MSHGEAAVSPERCRPALHLHAVRRAHDLPVAAAAAASARPALGGAGAAGPLLSSGNMLVDGR